MLVNITALIKRKAFNLLLATGQLMGTFFFITIKFISFFFLMSNFSFVLCDLAIRAGYFYTVKRTQLS